MKQGLMKLEIQIKNISFFQYKYVPNPGWFSIIISPPLQSYLLSWTAVWGGEWKGVNGEVSPVLGLSPGNVELCRGLPSALSLSSRGSGRQRTGFPKGLQLEGKTVQVSGGC